MIKKLTGLFALFAALLVLSAPAAHAQANLNVNVTGYTLTSDPCQVPTNAKTSIAVNISTATTTRLVALSGTKSIYVCNFTSTVTGTAPTLLFETGTGATCGTTTVSITGTFAITTGSLITFNGAGVQFKAGSGLSLCVVSGGTTPSVQGYMTFVQQ